MNNLISYAVLVVLLLFYIPSMSAEKVKLGTYSMATESDWGAAFTLKAKGVAVVTPWFWSGEGIVKPEQKKDVVGSWKETEDGVELAFSNFKDRFKFEKECEDWRDYPCLRYQKSLASTKEKSPLNEQYPFINWSLKNSGPHTVTKKCLDQCSAMAKNGELKKSMTVDSCAKELCK